MNRPLKQRAWLVGSGFAMASWIFFALFFSASFSPTGAACNQAITPPQSAGRNYPLRSDYPSDFHEGDEATVIVDLLVDEKGNVSEVKVESASKKFRLNRKSDDVARRFTYRPAMQCGVPVSYRLKVPVRWSVGDTVYRERMEELIEMAERGPGKLRASDGEIFHAISTVREIYYDDNFQARFLNALENAKWTPADPRSSADSYFFDLARVRIQEGRLAEAAKLMNKVSSPYFIVAAKSDKQFDVLAQLSVSFDVRERLQGYVKKYDSRAAQASASLRDINKALDALYLANRLGEALSVADAAMKDAGFHGGKNRFSDMAEGVRQTMYMRAILLRELKRNDEFVRQVNELIEYNGGVWQSPRYAFLLARFYLDMSRPDDALNAIEGIKNTEKSVLPDNSTYEKLGMASVRTCAYAQKGDMSQARKSLNEFRGHENEQMYFYQTALICMNDMETLSGHYVELLSQPRQRSRALMRCQNFQGDETGRPFGEIVSQRWKTLCSHPAVAAKISEVGRIGTYPIRN